MAFREYLRRNLPAPAARGIARLFRRPVVENRVALALDEEEVARGRFFDKPFYEGQAKVTFETANAAARHYLDEGEKRGLRPSEQFDPAFYKTFYPDLIHTPLPLILHYSRHGVAEGRFGAVCDKVILNGEREFIEDRDTVLVCVHEASRTGAPILGLNLVRILSRNYNVITAMLRGGELVSHFAEHSHKVICPVLERDNPVVQVELAIKKIHEAKTIDMVLANSVEASSMVKMAHHLGLPSVSLVHEFAEYTMPISKMADMFRFSNAIVYSSNLTKASAQASLRADWRNEKAHVFPQGKCEIPNGADHSTTDHVSRELFTWKKGKFLCIGCGAQQTRKGVDLFIAAAAQTVTLIGADNVRFLWIGEEEPGLGPVWLKDQIARSGLSDVVHMIPALSGANLENMYRIADAMFLSSRLDPFPNVAIDAIVAGLPVVCFEKASGVAEYISQVEGLEQLVVPYFDIAAAAAAIAKLATNQEFRATASTSLLGLAADMDMDRYVGKLIALMENAKQQMVQQQADIDLLVEEGVLCPETLRVDRSKDRREIVIDYVRSTSHERHARRPFPGFSPHIYRSERPSLNGIPLADWIREGKPQGRFIREVLDLSNAAPRPDISGKLKIALHLHLHYTDLASAILERIESNTLAPDLFISTTDSETAEYLSRLFKRYRRGVVDIRVVQNKGRDVAPMLVEFRNELAAYDLIGHFHGKRSLHIAESSSFGGDMVHLWRDFLLDNLIGDTCRSIDIIATEFARREKLGLVFAEDPHICGWDANQPVAQEIARRIGIDALPSAIEFPVGNMFWARPQALASLLTTGFSMDDFPSEPAPTDGTIMHALERLTPIVCEQAGFDWITTRVAGANR